MTDRADRLAQLDATYRRMADATVRNGESGWRFYDASGYGHALSPEEGAALHEEAMGRVDRLIAALDGGSWFGVLIAAAVGFVFLKVLAELQLFGMSPSWIFLVVGLYWLFRDVIVEVRFALDTHVWREGLARQLRARSEREDEAGRQSFVFDVRSIAGLLCALAGGTLLAWLVIADAPVGLPLVAVLAFGAGAWNLLRRTA